MSGFKISFLNMNTINYFDSLSQYVFTLLFISSAFRKLNMPVFINTNKYYSIFIPVTPRR